MAKFTGTPGTDTFIGTDADADIFRFDPINLSSSDTVSGGLGTVHDTFAITAAGTITAAQLAHVSGIETVQMFAGSLIDLTEHMLDTARDGSINVIGSAGNDTLDTNLVTAVTKSIVFTVGTGNDWLIGGAGRDTVKIDAAALSSQDHLDGGASSDALVLTSAGSLSSHAFDNISSFERIVLNAGGNDIFLNPSMVDSTTNGVVVVTGGASDDNVDAQLLHVQGSVRFNGGGGNDSFYGGEGNDSATGGSGFNELNGNGGNDYLRDGYHAEGGAGADTLINCADARGDQGNDTIINSNGATLNYVYGGVGKDTINVVSADVAAGVQYHDAIEYYGSGEGLDLIKGSLGFVNAGDVLLQFNFDGFSTKGNDFDQVYFDNGAAPTGPGGPVDGADLVLYNNGGSGLGSAADVDDYFYHRYYIASGVGAFFANYNNTTHNASIYYDDDAYHHAGVEVIATIQNISATEFAKLGSHFEFSAEAGLP